MKLKEITPEHLAGNKGVTQLTWSRDDKYIFFISNLGEYFNLWSIPSRGGFPRQVGVFHGYDIARLELSPDGKYLALMMDQDGRENFELHIIKSHGGSQKKISGSLAINFPDVAWSPDSKKIVVIAQKEGNYNLVTLNIEGEEKWLTHSPQLKRELHWVEDKIVYTAFHSQLKSDIYMVSGLEAEEPEIRNLTDFLEGENHGGKLSPDCKTLGFTSDARGMKNVAFMDIETRKVTWISQKKNEQIFGNWNHQGNRYLFTRNEEGELSLFESDFPPTRTKRIIPRGHNSTLFRYSNNDKKIALKLSSPVKTGEIYIREGNSLYKLTDFKVHGLDSSHFVEPLRVKYNSFDGLSIPALYYKPKNCKNYPVLIWIHGGPTSQHYANWDPFIQICLLNKIGVLAPNIRGSSGYGRDFENKNFHDWGGGDLQDIIHAVNYIKTDPHAHKDNIMVGGGSYGGYMTMMAVTQFPRLWKCGINMMGPVNLETLYTQGHPWLHQVLREKYGFHPPEEDPDFYTDRSPINFIENIEAPLLLLYCKNDPRVTISQLEQLRTQMDQLGKNYRWEEISDEGHSSHRLASRINLYSKMIDFIRSSVNMQDIVELPVEEEEEVPGEPDYNQQIREEPAQTPPLTQAPTIAMPPQIPTGPKPAEEKKAVIEEMTSHAMREEPTEEIIIREGFYPPDNSTSQEDTELPAMSIPPEMEKVSFPHREEIVGKEPLLPQPPTPYSIEEDMAPTIPQWNIPEEGPDSDDELQMLGSPSLPPPSPEPIYNNGEGFDGISGMDMEIPDIEVPDMEIPDIEIPE